MNLLRVAVEDSLDVGIRQVAVITFKNAVKKDWDPLGAPSTPPLAHLPHMTFKDFQCVSAICQGRAVSATSLHTEAASPASMLWGYLGLK